ncbi:hypothetical protein [Ligilactobacillus murinus]|uniref:hypothetical protein n=1 Tax=Ligilactobacillus murinus TaxID=1622 RepID=UPI001575D217|nr:hypothetical protein [Ligilactobacillus murinus]
MEKKTSKAQAKARDKWNEKNKAKKKVYSYRSYTRKFIKEMATIDDIQEIKQLLAEA